MRKEVLQPVQAHSAQGRAWLGGALAPALPPPVGAQCVGSISTLTGPCPPPPPGPAPDACQALPCGFGLAGPQHLQERNREDLRRRVLLALPCCLLGPVAESLF